MKLYHVTSRRLLAPPGVAHHAHGLLQDDPRCRYSLLI
jgi:hypothetical protein